MNKPYAYYDRKNVNNLKEIMDLTIKRNPSETAFFYQENEKTIIKSNQDFYDEVTLLSNYLYHSYKNSHIAIIGENSYSFVVLFFAIVISGNVAVIIDKDLEEKTMLKLLKQSDTNIVFYSKKYNEFLGRQKKLEAYLIDDINEFEKKGKKYKNKHEIDDNALATIFFTSGTTGANKGVCLSQKSICADTVGSCSIFLLSGNAMAVLPFHHTFGFITSVIFPYYYGYPTFINSSIKKILPELKIAKPETMFAVPAFIETFYKQILAKAKKSNQEKKLKIGMMLSSILLFLGIDIRRKLFSSIHETFGGELHYIICGGAYLDPKYVKWFRKIGIEVLNGYGITECSPVVSVNRNAHFRDGSVGQLIKGCQVKVVDEEIAIRGDFVMLGYYKDEKATKEVLKDGWFYTGDLGYVDKEGFLFITGRKKNLIILSNGENVSPEEIEAIFLGDKAVSEAVVYEKDKKMIVAIYPNDNYMGNEEYFNHLVEKYNETVPINHRIGKVVLRDHEFIKNNNRKILRNKVEEES